ncbi:MAG TPA: hypothetical protein VFU37_05805 [Pyrinomonadaceae bacterium]|nr:hypothetical protein [Pyrinomonadaceae bacterium]
MSPSRSLFLAAILITAACGSISAQRRFERLPPPRDPQFYEPRNKLEDIDGRMETLLIKGRHWVGTMRAQNGSARVEAYEIKDTRTSDRATGVLITFAPADANTRADEIRSMIDYEEIDPLVKVIDTMIKADDNVTKLSHFEERYRTRGDFEVMVFKQQTGTSVAAAVEGGFFDRLRLFLIMDELVRLRYMIVQAKERLDEIK